MRAVRVLERWLIEDLMSARDESEHLDVVTLVASETVGEDELIAYLGHELMRNYVSPGELGAVFEDLGVPAVAEHLKKNKFPADVSVRRGEFGEALTGALLRRVERWCVPVLKLRYKQRPDQPVQGAVAVQLAAAAVARRDGARAGRRSTTRSACPGPGGRPPPAPPPPHR